MLLKRLQLLYHYDGLICNDADAFDLPFQLVIVVGEVESVCDHFIFILSFSAFANSLLCMAVQMVIPQHPELVIDVTRVTEALGP